MSSKQIAPVLADLHLLTVLSQARSFTQAARLLGVSKASVSMRISNLESAIGVPLVRRTTRSVVLTEAAMQLVEDTLPSFARIEQSLDSVKDLAGNPRGLVRVSAPVALGRQRIAPMLPGFLRQYPEIRIDLDLTDRFVNLAQEGFDLAIRHAHTVPETHVAWVLRESRSLLVASREYLERHGAPAHPRDLSSHECLMYLRHGSAQSWSFENLIAPSPYFGCTFPFLGV
jgi:DNA-binding transcriptional LysR family regulator